MLFLAKVILYHLLSNSFFLNRALWQHVVLCRNVLLGVQLAQIFKRCSECTRNNTLQLLRHFALEADKFSSYFDYFKDEG